MKIGTKWQFISALALAGLLSLYASFYSAMGLLWGGFGRQDFPIGEFFLLLAPLLAFPLFAFAAASSRLAAFGLWTLGPAYSLVLFQINAGSFVGNFMHYLGLLLACLFDRTAVFLWITAWLVQFGARIYNPPRDAEPAATIGS